MNRYLNIAAFSASLLLTTSPAGAVAPSVSGSEFAQTVDARLADWWLKPDERRFDTIGWAPDVRTAQKLAAEHDRPLFLFTMDGRVNTGRC
jgi:hypothetical protein